MTTVWLLLLLVVSSHSVDSQSTDDEVCDGEDDNMCDEEQFFEMKRDIQILQKGKSSSTINTFCINFSYQSKFLVAVLELVLTNLPSPTA